MKNIKLEIQDVNGNLLSESNLVLEEGDKLLIQVPVNIKRSDINKVVDWIKKTFEDNEHHALILPDVFDVKVLKVK